MPKKESMSSRVTIYQKPTCSTCREALKLVQASGLPFSAINYYEQPFTRAQLTGLLRKAGLSARDILRTKDFIYVPCEGASKFIEELLFQLEKV